MVVARPPRSQALFDAKGMAGNIIHAIATTNAIISGLIVVEALKVLAGGPMRQAACVCRARNGCSNALHGVDVQSAPKADG